MPQITNVYDSIQLRGTVVERGRRSVYAEGPCKVVESYVKAGDQVREGDALVRIASLERDQMLPAIYSDLEKSLTEFAEGAVLSDPDALRQQAESLLDLMAVSAGSFPAGVQTITETILRSPIDGIVMQVMASGDSVSGILPCAIVSDMTKLAVQAQIGEGMVRRVSESMPCEIWVEAFQEQAFSGVIESIMPYARQTGGLTTPGEVKTQVNVWFDAPDGLRPGYSALVKAKANYQLNVATLPYEAISQDEENREYVYVLHGDQAVKTYILTGREMEALVEIKEGVGGEDIVILNPENITHGQRVIVR